METDKNIELETDRLFLKPMRIEDQKDIYLLINHDKEVLRYFIDQYHEKEEDLHLPERIERYQKAGLYCFSIFLKDTNQLIGEIFQCSKPSPLMNTTEIGFALGKAYWNKGYMSEALKAMIDFLLSLGIHKVVACHIKENTASGAVMRKCGMLYEGIRKEEIYYHEKYWDTCHYYLINNRK